MSINHANAKNALTFIAATVCFLAVTATRAESQTGRPTVLERRIDQIERQRQQHERDSLSKEGKPQRSVDRKQMQALAAQVTHDFERIQSVYNEIVRALSDDKRPMDYKFISEASAEVKKCASRLKSNLLLPEPEPDEKSHDKQIGQDDKDVKASLVVLCKSIIAFVTNPLFESDGALDVELSLKANRDLIKIIEMSDQVKKIAEKIGKSSP